jgi:tetratricopeptide (TPR) repeat protein
VKVVLYSGSQRAVISPLTISNKEGTMNQRTFGPGLLFLIVLVWSGCDSGQYGEGTQTEGTSEGTSPAVTEAPSMTEAPPPEEDALMAPVGLEGATENEEGVSHYRQGHWDVSAEHFGKAVAANPELAEAHYNLALALDKMGNHGEATNHFKRALALAPANPKIAGSKILQDHVGG